MGHVHTIRREVNKGRIAPPGVILTPIITLVLSNVQRQSGLEALRFKIRAENPQKQHIR